VQCGDGSFVLAIDLGDPIKIHFAPDPRPMTYTISLFATGLITGLLLIVAHGAAILAPDRTASFLRSFSRSRFYGTLLLAIAAVWTLWLIRTIDLGEFAGLRNLMTFGAAVAAVLTWKFVDEFLAVRALAILGLLAAELLLCAALFQPTLARLWLVVLAYGWIFVGLFLVGLPWIFRDFCNWLTSRPLIFRGAATAGLLYGLILVGSSFIWVR